ncbi:MAG: hypothetical protein KGJ13_06135 [Patescibacteria group bacterium]|nr:hypothetical protein [Patescibacteria group bacterium]
MIITKTPQKIVDARAMGRAVGVIVQVDTGATANVIFGENYGKVASGKGLAVAAGNSTSQFTVTRELYAVVDPAAAVGTTVEAEVIVQ